MAELPLPPMSRVLICGDRWWGRGDSKNPLWHIERNLIASLLTGLYEEHMVGFGSAHLTPFTVIEGVARGADSVAHWWAKSSPLHSHNVGIEERFDSIEFVHLPFPALWDTYGRAAGPIRNQQMLDEGNPNLVVAFHHDIESSKGTKDMVNRSRKAGIPTFVVS